MEMPVYVKIMSGINQTVLDNYVCLHFPVYDQRFSKLFDVDIEISETSTVSQLTHDIYTIMGMDDEIPLRIVSISSGCIVGTLSHTTLICDITELSIRAEFIPDDQRNIEDGGYLIRCCFSHNINYPFNGCFMTPFYLLVVKDEPFELTQCRILSLIEEQIGHPRYILYLGKVIGPRFRFLRDNDTIYDLAKSTDSVLFIMISPEYLLSKYGRNKGVEITN